MLVPVIDQQRAIAEYCSDETMGVIEAAKDFIRSGMSFRNLVLDVWVRKEYDTAWYYDGISNSYFGGDTEEERFASWLKYVCQAAGVADGVRSSLYGFCTIVVPLVEAQAIKHTLVDVVSLPDSISNRVTSVIRRVLADGFTDESFARIDAVIEVAGSGITAAEFELWLEANGLKSKREPTEAVKKKLPVVTIINGNGGSIFMIRAEIGEQYEQAMKLVAKLPMIYEDGDEQYFEDVFKELNDGIRSSHVEVGSETSFDGI